MNARQLQFFELHTVTDDFDEDVLSGLRQTTRSISPKYFYDEKGSQLFDEITNTEEYYPTRTEIGILSQSVGKIAEIVGSKPVLIEPGGGSCSKVRILLDALRPEAYVPMDICSEHLKSAARQTAIDYPWLSIYAACVDFSREIILPGVVPDGRRVVFFPGSTIGNFHPREAKQLLARLARLIGEHGYLLIGVDLKKDAAVLRSAYNDAKGFTAAFNLNLLARINRELDANFEISNWRHKAIYNEQAGRVEMHLESKQNQIVTIDNEVFKFEQGETIHTENSYKYTCEEFSALAKSVGFDSCLVWTDADELFSVHLFQTSL